MRRRFVSLGDHIPTPRGRRRTRAEEEARRQAEQAEERRLREESRRQAEQAEERRLREESQRRAKQAEELRLREESRRQAEQAEERRLHEEIRRQAESRLREARRLREESRLREERRINEEQERRVLAGQISRLRDQRRDIQSRSGVAGRMRGIKKRLSDLSDHMVAFLGQPDEEERLNIRRYHQRCVDVRNSADSLENILNRTTFKYYYVETRASNNVFVTPKDFRDVAGQVLAAEDAWTAFLNVPQPFLDSILEIRNNSLGRELKEDWLRYEESYLQEVSRANIPLQFQAKYIKTEEGQKHLLARLRRQLGAIYGMLSGCSNIAGSLRAYRVDVYNVLRRIPIRERVQLPNGTIRSRAISPRHRMVLVNSLDWLTSPPTVQIDLNPRRYRNPWLEIRR